MFVQTGYFIESEGLNPAEKVTFYGQEKAETNTRLAKMNLAVHGLEGNIQEGNTFYDDKHNLVGKCDFVMANPPFNVDGVDKGKDAVKKDPRLPFGLPKNDNANYLWIQYFYSYLKPTGRAGFVMASSASDAGHSEKDIREKLVKTGAVDVMVAIGNNFFYTRSLPCTLWFFDRAKELNEMQKDKVLMLDARKIYRKVTSKVNDFSPEQLLNLICIVNLYRGSSGKFESTTKQYLETSAGLAVETATAIFELQKQLQKVSKIISEFTSNLSVENKDEITISLKSIQRIFQLLPSKDATESIVNNEIFSAADIVNFEEGKLTIDLQNKLISDINSCEPDIAILENIAKQCKALRKPQDKLIKQILDTIAVAIKEHQLTKNKDWKAIDIQAQCIAPLKSLQQQLSGNPDEDEPGLLHETEYFWKQAHWLQSRFPNGVYTDVEGLCKVVRQQEIKDKDWSLSPGRYVGVDTASDEDFDYEERLKEIHIELEGLNEEAIVLAQIITGNYKKLAI
jgi:type I restriction enzyme M protein